MSNSRLALVYLLGFAGAIVVASYAGFRDFLPVLLEGTLVTIEITAMSAMVSVPCAVAAALAKIYGVLPLRWLAVAYIEIFRGTSALVQLFWLFFVLPHFGITLEPITAAVITMAGVRGIALSGFLVRKEAKGHGTNRYVEGPVQPGDPVAIVEDVVTTGGSSLEAIKRCEEFGLRVVRVVTIIDRLEGGGQAFLDRGYPYSSLLTARDFGI